jgi:hypothetical protein
MSPQPGIFYVNSKISCPDQLSTGVFHSWYEDVHIPDIFRTSGMKAAMRFQSTAPEDVERPYLALYPVKDVGFLSSPEFYSIPVHSDMLPNPSKYIFDVANFDTRHYVALSGEVWDPSQRKWRFHPIFHTRID